MLCFTAFGAISLMALQSRLLLPIRMLTLVYFAPTYNTLHVPPKLVTLQFCFSTEIVLPCNRTTKCYFRLKPNTALPQFKTARDIASVSVSNFVGQQRTVSQFCLYVCGSKTKPLTDSQPQHNVCYQHTYLMSSKERRAELQITSITTDFFSSWFLRNFAHLGQTAMKKPTYTLRESTTYGHATTLNYEST